MHPKDELLSLMVLNQAQTSFFYSLLNNRLANDFFLSGLSSV